MASRPSAARQASPRHRRRRPALPTYGLHWSPLLVDSRRWGLAGQVGAPIHHLTVRLLAEVPDPAAVEKVATRRCGLLAPEAPEQTAELLPRLERRGGRGPALPVGNFHQ
jgi:hypothetical protein